MWDQLLEPYFQIGIKALGPTEAAAAEEVGRRMNHHEAVEYGLAWLTTGGIRPVACRETMNQSLFKVTSSRYFARKTVNRCGYISTWDPTTAWSITLAVS